MSKQSFFDYEMISCLRYRIHCKYVLFSVLKWVVIILDEFAKGQKINLLSFRRNRLCRNGQNVPYCSFYHSGLDPEFSSFSECYETGCRIRHSGLDPGPG